MRLPFWRARSREEDLRDELHSHLKMAGQDRQERGEPTITAEQAVRREFGNVELVQQVTRDQWGWIWVEELVQDLRYGARMLRKNIGFTTVAVLTLALGIGANTSLFSVVNGVILNPLPFPDPKELVTLYENKIHFGDGDFLSQFPRLAKG